LNTCTNFALKNGFKIIQFFGGTYESAKVDEDRKQFKSMLSFVTDPQNSIGAIIVFNYDRFSRTGLQAIEIISVLQKHQVKVFSAINNFDPDSLEGKVMLTMTLLQANITNVNKSLDTRRKIKAKLENGIWSHGVPRGYSRNEKKEIYINKEGKLIREAFKMIIKGYTAVEIQKHLLHKGLFIKLKRWQEIFHNPFYCGILMSRTTEYQPLQGKHPKTISVEDFKRVVNILEDRKFARHIDEELANQLPLKIHLRCQKCGGKFTGYIRPYYDNLLKVPK
jgi:site-specific DNA recombinase